MTEAYKVGITIALANNISRGLGLIAGDLKKTDAQAAKLHATLRKIEKIAITGAIFGGAGYAGFKALESGYEAAKKYEQALNQFKSLNLGDAVNRQADKFARGAGLIGVSATDLMQTTRDLTTVLGDYGLARQLAPGFSQLKFANQAVYGGHGLDFNEAQLRSLEKIIEMKGGYKSANDFLGQANMMQQIIAGTGGMVKPADYLAFIKTAGVSGRLLSNSSFYYGMEPLIQEMGGNRVGTATMSAYNNLAQGRATVRAAREMMRLGIVDPSMVEYDKIGQVKSIHPGALKGMDEFTSDPYHWMKDVLIPAMAAKGITSKEGILNEMGALMGNRTASNLFSLMFLQQDKIEKNMAISKNAMGVNDLVKLAKSSPQGADMALGAAWENLKIAAGEALIPIIIPALMKMAEAFNWLGQAIARHPLRFDAIVYGLGALSAALAFSGIVLTLKAAFLGFSLVMPGVTSVMLALTPSISTLGTVAIALGASLGACAVAATVLIAALAPLAYHQKISNWVDSKAPGIGDFLYKATTPSEWHSSASSPQPNAKAIQVNTQVNLDGRQVANVVSDHQYSGMNRDLSSGSGFDGKLSFASPGVP